MSSYFGEKLLMFQSNRLNIQAILMDYLVYFMKRNHLELPHHIYREKDVTDLSLNLVMTSVRKLGDGCDLNFDPEELQIIYESIKTLPQKEPFQEYLGKTWKSEPSWRNLIRLIQIFAYMCKFSHEQGLDENIISYKEWTEEYFISKVVPWISKTPKGWKHVVLIAVGCDVQNRTISFRAFGGLVGIFALMFLYNLKCTVERAFSR